MANLTLSQIWEDVFQIETTTPVLGGPNGPMNYQAKNLGNRTEWLKGKLDSLGITDAAKFSGNMESLKTNGLYLILNAATNKPAGATGNGVCLVIARASVANGNNHYTHIYVDALQKIFVRTYIDNSPVDAWNELLSKAIYDAQHNAEVGQLSAFFGLTNVAGWLACVGGDYSRTQYADLFAVIGTTFGSGNGTTTFGIPDYESAGLPGAQFVWYIKY